MIKNGLQDQGGVLMRMSLVRKDLIALLKLSRSRNFYDCGFMEYSVNCFAYEKFTIKEV